MGKVGSPTERVLGSDLCVQPLGVVGLGRRKHENEAGERPGHLTGSVACPGCVAGLFLACPQSPADVSPARAGAGRMGLAPWSWGLGGWRWQLGGLCSRGNLACLPGY